MNDHTYVPCESCGTLNRVKQVPDRKAPVCGKCKTALAYHDGVAAPVVLASTHERALDIVPLEALQEHAVDVPADPSSLES